MKKPKPAGVAAYESKSHKVVLADHYYTVVKDLEGHAQRCLEIANFLGLIADDYCEQSIRETAPQEKP